MNSYKSWDSKISLCTRKAVSADTATDIYKNSKDLFTEFWKAICKASTYNKSPEKIKELINFSQKAINLWNGLIKSDDPAIIQTTEKEIGKLTSVLVNDYKELRTLCSGNGKLLNYYKHRALKALEMLDLNSDTQNTIKLNSGLNNIVSFKKKCQFRKTFNINPNEEPTDFKSLQSLILSKTIKSNGLFSDDIITPMDGYSSQVMNILPEISEESLNCTKRPKFVSPLAKNYFERFKRKNQIKTILRPLPNYKESGLIDMSCEKESSQNEIKINEILNDCNSAGKKTVRDIFKVISVRKLMKSQFTILDKKLKLSLRKPIKTKHMVKDAQNYLRGKYLFIYGKDSLGRYLDPSGRDQLKFRDRLVNANQNYSFIKEKCKNTIYKK